jgi:hypothetical protein
MTIDLEFSIISYDYYISQENIIKSIIMLQRKKTPMPNQYAFIKNNQFTIKCKIKQSICTLN